MMIWEVHRQMVQPRVKADKTDLIDLLSDGWEPFAVTWDGSAFDYHLRRQFDDGVITHNNNNCEMNPLSSAVCNLGTKCCTMQHNDGES